MCCSQAAREPKLEISSVRGILGSIPGRRTARYVFDAASRTLTGMPDTAIDGIEPCYRRNYREPEFSCCSQKHAGP
jgi:hypothetical protein